MPLNPGDAPEYTGSSVDKETVIEQKEIGLTAR